MYCAYPQYDYWVQSLLGLIIYLYCEFWVSYYGWFYAQQPKYTSVSSDSSLYHTKLLPFFLRTNALFSQCSLQNCQPLISHSLPLFIG